MKILMTQKYYLKGLVRSCKRWSELSKYLSRAYINGDITKVSGRRLYKLLDAADTDNIAEFEEIRDKFLEALNGKSLKQ